MEKGYSKLKCNKEGCVISYLSPKRVKMPKIQYADVIYERSFRCKRGRELIFQLGKKSVKILSLITRCISTCPKYNKMRKNPPRREITHNALKLLQCLSVYQALPLIAFGGSHRPSLRARKEGN